MTITNTIDEFTGTSPRRDQIPEDFETNVGDFLPWMEGLAVDLNITIGEINSTATDVNTDATTATNAANTATAQATIATEAANTATAAAADFTATSTTSTLIGTGSKAFAIETGKAFVVGQVVRIVSAANTANYMAGKITAASDGSITVNVIATGGSGTFADWVISLDFVSGASANFYGDLLLDGDAGLSGQALISQGGGVPIWDDVQEPLVSGVNIKTVNGTTLLGSGDISIPSSLSLISTSKATTAVSSIAITSGMDGAFSEYEILAYVKPSSNGTYSIVMQFLIGGVWVASYSTNAYTATGTSQLGYYNNTTEAFVFINPQDYQYASATPDRYATIRARIVNDGTFSVATGSCAYFSSSDMRTSNFSARSNTSGDVQGVRFLISSGSILGKLDLYGRETGV